MNSSSVLGLIFAEAMGESILPELSEIRTFGSISFGGKYRLIDFPVSNMANSGIDKIGVIIKNNYHSIMDHLGSGKAWGLSKRRGGLILLPPFIGSTERYGNRLETLYSIRSFIENSSEKYVLMSDCKIVANIDYKKMIDAHIRCDADITIMYKRGIMPKSMKRAIVLTLDDSSYVNQIRVCNYTADELENYDLSCYIIKRELLINLIDECISKNTLSFKRDILQSNVNKLKIYGYEFSGFTAILNNASEYFEANMALMSSDIRQELFNLRRPIFTKIRDDMPTKYGLGSSVKNSLIAQGCVIDGEVINCVISKSVKIGKGTTLKNCVIMQDTFIGDNCNLSYVIVDKDCKINDNRNINGFKTYPMCIRKRSKV